MCEICKRPNRCKCLHRYGGLQVRMTEIEEVFIVSAKTVRSWVDKGLLQGQKLPSGHRRVYFRDLWEFANVHGYGKEALAQWLREKGRVVA